MEPARPMRWYQRLRWRLSLFYVSVTIVLILIGFSIGEVRGYYWYHDLRRPEVIARIMSRDVEEVAPYIQADPVNTEAVALWLKNKTRPLRGRGEPPLGDLWFYGDPSVYTAVTDARGVVLASQPDRTLTVGIPLAEQIPQSQSALVKSALLGERSSNELSAIEGDNILVSAIPVFGGQGRVVGILFVHLYAPVDWSLHWSRVAFGLFRPVLTSILTALIGGIGFGLVTAHYLLSRLKAISTAADAWGSGDFSAVANDSTTDEVGQLAHRLNLMAKDLQDMLALKQEVAALGERNRLARDLHDTVKQQVFALSMQIGAAQRILKGGKGGKGGNGDDENLPELSKRLSEAEKLARQAQHDLVAIIKELQLADRTGKDFEEVLKEHVEDWSRQFGIAAEVKCGGVLPLSPQVEQVFFRIMQEALANTARHSQATRVSVEVIRGASGDVMLSIKDNGTGFDPGRTNGGMGLKNMRERAEALPGGWFKVERLEQAGVQVMAGSSTGATG